jgi:hypothetical protein
MIRSEDIHKGDIFEESSGGNKIEIFEVKG